MASVQMGKKAVDGSLIMKHSCHTKAEIVVFKVEKVAKAKKLAK